MKHNVRSFLAVLVLVYLQVHTRSLHIPIPSPERGVVVLCSSWTCFENNLDLVEQTSWNASSEKPLVVTLVVSSFESDPYIPLYLGWITHLFAKVSYLPYFFLIEPKVWTAEELSTREVEGNAPDIEISASTRERVVHANYRLLSLTKLRALKWVFVCLEEGESRFGISSLTELGMFTKENFNIVLPKIVLHLNHEKPWVFDVDALLQAYSPYSLVLRNYYFEPLSALDSVTILPLGPSYYNYIVNQHLFYGDRRFLLASERWRKGSLCYYSGRLNHSHHLRRPQTGDITKMTRLAFMYSSAEDGYDYDHSNYYQRYRLQEIVRAAAALSEPQGLGLCSYRSFDGSDTRGYHTMEVPGTGTKEERDEQYRSYLQLLASTVFLPAPGGNNPETFRLYEILELGGIPLLVQSVSANNISESDVETKRMSVVTHERLFPLRQAAEPFRTNSSGLFYHVHKRLCNDCRDPSLQSCDYPGPVFSSWEEAHCFVSMFHRAKKNLYCQTTPQVRELAAQLVSTESISAYLDNLQEQLGFWYSMRVCVAQSQIRDEL